MQLRRTPIRALGGALILIGSAQAQSFTNNTSDIPQSGGTNNSNSENVDFGDVDLDGDWDAVFADGGDCCNDQNRIWINDGYAQGGTIGVFIDRTSQRFPAIQDSSRDIEFADIDNDTDLDIYVSQTSEHNNQSNRWWVNQGMAQGGNIGFYNDETAARWVNIAGPGSSISNSSKLAGGGFLDWSCDCDFADLDNDGDLDLVHSSYGGQFDGGVPTRLFLNDGNGFFEEFNPAGVQLTGTDISNGTAAIWCEGVHIDDTTDTTGAQCDIADNPLDIDLGDFDGDLDIDILHGARNQYVRIFENRLEENGGTLGFRDVTFARFTDTSNRSGNYEQEIGDIDNDGDLDIYGLNWGSSSGGFSLSDVILKNDGNGNFGTRTVLANSSPDDNEGDFIDYDNDGDVDLLVASFTFDHRMYRNDGTGAFTDVSNAALPNGINSIGLDVDIADLDEDGDYDAIISHDGGAKNVYLENTHNVADTHAPRLYRLEQAPNRAASATPTVVRVQVYDNTSYYITWYNNTWLEVTVDGGTPTTYPMITSGGQIFRGEIPGNLVGNVVYRAFSEDQYGNQASTPTESYTATGGGCSPTVYCTAAQNPSSNGCVASISTSSPGVCPVAGANNYDIVMSGGEINKPGIVFYSLSGQATIPFSSGQLCVQPPIQRTAVQNTGNGGGACTGALSLTVNDPGGINFTTGTQVNFQCWMRDPASAPTTDVSDAVEVTFQ